MPTEHNRVSGEVLRTLKVDFRYRTMFVIINAQSKRYYDDIAS